MATDEFDALFVKDDELIDKTLLVNVLLKYVKLTEGGEVIYENDFHSLPNAQRILIFLLARKVLKMKSLIDKEELGPTEISKAVGLPVGSVKSVFHFTKENVFSSVNGEYKIPNFMIKKVNELLTGPSENGGKPTRSVPRTSAKGGKRISNMASERIREAEKKLDRTKYAKLTELSSSKEKALYLLKIFKDEFKMDGLTVNELSYVLTNVFRVPTSKEAISMALMKSMEVHRYKEIIESKEVYVYKIMKPGEDYLTELLK